MKRFSDRAVIVASGPSARGFVPPDDVIVIAVNQAINYLPRCDHWFTLDPSQANIETMREKRKGVTYWCAIENRNKQIPSHVNILTRVSEQKPKPRPPKHSPQWEMFRLQARCKLDTREGYISSGNSAWGALGLAYHLGAKKVVLIGVDADESPKLDGGKCRTRMHHLPILFASATDQIDMVSCGKMQAKGIPNMSIDEGMAWLRS